jgi:hypothetical protein
VRRPEASPRGRGRVVGTVESRARGRIDASRESFYSRNVPVRKIQVGQLWKKDGTGESYLVTKIYNEALATFAVLRKAGAETEPPIRIKVVHSGPAATLPGYSYAQEAGDF